MRVRITVTMDDDHGITTDVQQGEGVGIRLHDIIGSLEIAKSDILALQGRMADTEGRRTLTMHDEDEKNVWPPIVDR